MKATKRAKCETPGCGYDTNITDGRPDGEGYAIKSRCKKCGGKLKLGTDWIVRGMHNGEIFRENCGPDKAAALYFIGKCLESKQTGDIRPKKEPVLTWQDGLKAFAEAPMKDATRMFYSDALKSLGKTFGTANLVDITPERITQWTHKRRKEGVSARTIGAGVGTIKRMFTLVCEPLRSKEYPRLHEAMLDIQKVKKPAQDNYKDEFFTPDEIKRLIDCAPDHLKLWLRIMTETGLRPGNVYAMRFDQIADDGTVSLPGDVMKNGKPFVTSISKSLLLDIKKYALLNGYRIWLFPSTVKVDDKPVHDMRSSWQTACKAAGLKGTPHKLRHSFASIMLGQGVPLSSVSILLAHSNVSITLKRYAHLERKLLDDTLTEYRSVLGI